MNVCVLWDMYSVPSKDSKATRPQAAGRWTPAEKAKKLDVSDTKETCKSSLSTMLVI